MYTNHKAEEGPYMASRERQEIAALWDKVRNRNIYDEETETPVHCHHRHLFEVLVGLSKPQSVRPQKSPGQEAATSVSPWMIEIFDDRK